MSQVKRTIAIILILGMATLLSGCGYPELYERILIHGVGVDWDGAQYRVTVRSSASAEDEGEEFFTSEGSTVLEALSALSLSTGREPFYSHNYLVVFGMDCARRGLDDCLDFFVRYYNTRPAVEMFLAEGTAEEVLSAEKDGKLLKMSGVQALGSAGAFNGMTADVEILDFVNGVKGEGMSPVLPVLRATESGVEAAGTAYFDGYKIKGLLTLEQTRGYLAAVGKLKKGELAVAGQADATLSLREVKSQVALAEKGQPSFTVTVEAEADVSAAKDAAGSQDDFYHALEQEAEALLQGEMESAMEQAMVKDGCDIFGFGRKLYRERPEDWRKVEAWPNQEIQWTVEVRFKVRRMEQENMNGIH